MTYVVSANEGDARDYDGFSEEARVADLPLDSEVFPDAATLADALADCQTAEPWTRAKAAQWWRQNGRCESESRAAANV